MSLSKKNKTLILFLILAFLVGFFGFKYMMKAPAKIETKAVDFIGTSDVFLTKIQENATIWQDKVVELTGTITSKDEKGITLSNQIYCQFREDVNFSALENNQQLTLKGRVIGYDDLLEELKLDQCIIK
ncbi:hypothetical protein OD91_1956 [Lutibacter sp. Hel_I_33_5]|uniref:hypothetical protein n=1 Tax=Lutibacter sp. Hel_I_33_5 TaxID=1566289 RepID=UPI0011A2DB72|nr:hypothetical protein [Lutibacter sp. Hel_I_33_5]TVZ56660.1 hypothetical protein OD91_1956 [Lutibacter sp. Hel_I_33_5]